MLTTTLDGIWILQVLSGIEVLAPELGLRPHLPSAETRQMALRHPVALELHQAGAISELGVVDEPILDWFTVLSRRDAAFLFLTCSASSSDQKRVLLARFKRWWVAIERNGLTVEIRDAGTAGTEQSARQVISTQVNRLCGNIEPLAFRPVTLDLAELTNRVRDHGSLRAFLSSSGLDINQLGALAQATDTSCARQTSIVSVRSGSLRMRSRSQVDPNTVTIIDGPNGRLLSEPINRDDRNWIVVSPGTPGQIAAAIRAMLRRCPVEQEGHSNRKAVS